MPPKVPKVQRKPLKMPKVERKPVIDRRQFTWQPGMRDKNYQIVALWQGTDITRWDVNPLNPDNVMQFAKDQWGTRIKPIGVVTTLPGDGGPGGRTDFAFLVHNQDVLRFAVTRLKVPSDAPRWWEDAYHQRAKIYPQAFINAYPV